MSSSEQAPEPTMDEILASIRKIISDDEPGDSPPTEAAAPEAPPQAEGALADELANALSDTQAEPGAVDDILDLTQVVSEQVQNEAPQSEAPQVDALQAALSEAIEAPAPKMPEAPEANAVPQSAPAPKPEDAPAGDQPSGDIDISAVLAEAGIEETISTESTDPAPAATALEDDLSATLGQSDAPQITPDPTPAAAITEAPSAIDPAPEYPGLAAAPDAEMAEAPDLAADEPVREVLAEASIDKGVYKPEPVEPAADVPAAAPADAGAGNSGSDLTAEPAAEPGDMLADAPAESTAFDSALHNEAEPAEEAAPAAEQETVEAVVPVLNTSEGRTLEDSVKDMLRPMLREWLDENMERIVQKEVSAENLQGSDS